MTDDNARNSGHDIIIDNDSPFGRYLTGEGADDKKTITIYADGTVVLTGSLNHPDAMRLIGRAHRTIHHHMITHVLPSTILGDDQDDPDFDDDGDS